MRTPSLTPFWASRALKSPFHDLHLPFFHIIHPQFLLPPSPPLLDFLSKWWWWWWKGGSMHLLQMPHICAHNHTQIVCESWSILIHSLCVLIAPFHSWLSQRMMIHWTNQLIDWPFICLRAWVWVCVNGVLTFSSSFVIRIRGHRVNGFKGSSSYKYKSHDEAISFATISHGHQHTFHFWACSQAWERKEVKVCVCYFWRQTCFPSLSLTCNKIVI